jgi:branched-chain amino acid transport system permease protein
VSANLANILITGITTGCIYGLIGVGFVVIFRATGVVSFAQGAFMVLGALIFSSVVHAGGGLAAGIVVAGGALFLGGGLVYWIVFSRLVGGEAFVVSIATVGLGTLLEAIALLVWGPNTINVPTLFSSQLHDLSGTLKVNDLDLFTVILTVAVFVIIVVGLQRTPVGLRMRAVANNPKLAGFTGVNVVRISMLAWSIAALAAGLAGVVFLLGAQPDPGSVYSLGLSAFPAILLGGIDSVGGALIGGILIGLLQSTVGIYIGGSWQDVVSYMVLLVVLLFRPQGLFGSAEIARL